MMIVFMYSMMIVISILIIYYSIHYSCAFHVCITCASCIVYTPCRRCFHYILSCVYAYSIGATIRFSFLTKLLCLRSFLLLKI